LSLDLAERAARGERREGERAGVDDVIPLGWYPIAEDTIASLPCLPEFDQTIILELTLLPFPSLLPSFHPSSSTPTSPHST
jgi:hypothetical protein